MGWDQAGNYNRVHNFSADASAGIKILASRMDAEINDIASAFTRVWTRDGQNTPTTDLPMGGRRFVNVGAPTSVSQFMRSREFIENIPIFMQDAESSADRVSVSAQYFTSVSANQAPGDGTRILVRANSNKSSAVLYLNGHSANVEYQDGNRIDAAMVSGGIYEMIFSSTDIAWKIQNPDDGRTPAEIAAGVTPTSYQIPSHQSATHVLAERYGCSPSASAATNLAAINNAFSVVEVLGGGFVQLPNGIITVSDRILIPNVPYGAGIRGCGPSATTLKASDTFSNTNLIRNESIDGTQEYAFVEQLLLDGNKAGGASITSAVLEYGSVFINSYVRDVIITNAPVYGLRLRAYAAAGPVQIENTWVVSSNQHNILVDEDAGNTGAVAGYQFLNVASEHQGGGYSAFYLSGTGHTFQVSLIGCHVEQVNGGTAGTTALTLAGIGDLVVDGFQVQSASSSYGGIVITNSASNVRFKFSNITNINVIATIINDQKNTVIFGAVHVPWYASPEHGVHPNGVQTLTYGATVSTNCALGNYCILVITNGTGFTMANPTNMQIGQWLSYEIVNASGGTHGDITWGGDFDYLEATVPTSVNKIANGLRRVITFRMRAASSWALAGQATGDM